MLISSKLVVDLMIYFANTGVSLSLAEDSKTLLVNKIPFVASKWEHDELANYHCLTENLQKDILEDMKVAITKLANTVVTTSAAIETKNTIIAGSTEEDEAEIDRAFSDAGIKISKEGDVIETKAVESEAPIDTKAVDAKVDPVETAEAVRTRKKSK